MALTQAVMGLNTIWWANKTAALGIIVAAFALAAWHGAGYYFDHFAHRYLAGLGIETRKKTPPGPSAVAVASAGEGGAGGSLATKSD